MKTKSIKSFKLKLITNYKKESNRSKNEHIRKSLLLTLELFNNKVREIQEFFVLCKQETIKINENGKEYLLFKDTIQDKLIDKIKEIHVRNGVYNSYMFYIVNRNYILNVCRELYDVLFSDDVKANEHGNWATILFGMSKRTEYPDIFKSEKDTPKRILAYKIINLGMYPVFSSYNQLMYDNGKKKKITSNIRFEKDCLNVVVQNFKSWRTWEKLFIKELDENKLKEKDELKLHEYNDKNNLNNYLKFTYANYLNSPRPPNYEYKDINRHILNYKLYSEDEKLFIEITLLHRLEDETLEFKDFNIQLANTKQKQNIKMLDNNIIQYRNKDGTYVETKLGGAKLSFDRNFIQNNKLNKNYPGNIFITITEELNVEPILNPDYILGIDLGVRSYASYSIVKRNSDSTIQVIKSGHINLEGDCINKNIQLNRDKIMSKITKVFNKLYEVKEYKKTDKDEFHKNMVGLKVDVEKLLKIVKHNEYNNLHLGISLWSIKFHTKIRTLLQKYMNIYNKSNVVQKRFEYGNKNKNLLEHLNNIKSNRLKTGCSKIINLALEYNCKTIVFEDLSNFKVSSYKNSESNILLADWSVGKTKDLLEMSCKFYNIDLKTVNPMYTSQLDNKSGIFGKRFNIVKGRYVHSNCGKYFISLNRDGSHKIQDADINASLNIINTYLYNEKNKSNKNKKQYVDNFYKKQGKQVLLKDLHGVYFDHSDDVPKEEFSEVVTNKIITVLDKIRGL